MSGTLAEHLKHGRRVCFDSAAIIYLLEDHPVYGAMLRPVFEMLDRGLVDGFTSTITLMEILVKPLREGRRELADDYARSLSRAVGFQIFPIDRQIARRGAELRAAHRFKAPDALQLATACLHEADAFLTNDKDLRSCSGVNVVVSDDFLP